MAGHPRRKTFSGPFSLKGDFLDPSFDKWRSLATKSLRGKPLDRLTIKIDDGVAVRPLYTVADDSPPPGLPGRAPFTRGSTEPARRPSGWLSCQLYDHPDLACVAQQLSEEHDPGTSAVWIKMAGPIRQGIGSHGVGDGNLWTDGVFASTTAHLMQLCAAIETEATTIILDGGGAGFSQAALFTAAARTSGADLGTARGSFGIDPLASLASDGELVLGGDRSFALMADLGAWCLREAPGMRAAAVSTIPYHMAGASPVQEMAFALATGVQYLRAFDGAGIEPKLACRQMLFRFAVGRDLFTEVARMRAFRRLWARVAGECGVSDDAAAPVIHAVTSPRSLTTRDPWVNMLRATVGTFAAAIGGADFITTLPFDSAIGQPGDLGRRMAVNSHRVLREESHLGHVLDPAGGSWYIERLTEELANAAWRSFQDIERHGGMRQSLADGMIASAVDEAARAGRQATATRKAPITGISTWPNLAEQKLTPPVVKIEPLLERVMSQGAGCPDEHPALATLAGVSRAAEGGPRPGVVFEAAVAAAEAGATLHQLNHNLRTDSKPSTMTPLPCSRDAEPFEDLRDASDSRLAATGQRPRAFLANLGSVADYTARTTFAKNVLEAGGIETIASSGLDSADAAVAAFVGSGCAAVCLCSSDERYEALAADIVPALRAKGAKLVLLAGRPGPEGAEVDHSIYAGCDVVETLGAVLSTLEATS